MIIKKNDIEREDELFFFLQKLMFHTKNKRLSMKILSCFKSFGFCFRNMNRKCILKFFTCFLWTIAVGNGQMEDTPVEEAFIEKLLDLYDNKLGPLLRYVDKLNGRNTLNDVYQLLKPSAWTDTNGLEDG